MKILYISDFDLKGSGYYNISVPLCMGLHKLGHEIKAVGLGYDGSEQNFPFSLIPAKNFGEANAMLYNLKRLWKADILIAALDIPWHEKVLMKFKEDKIQLPYVGIFAVEGDPLCMSWAMSLMQMDAQLVISQFGTEECRKVGVPARHLEVGIDTESWRIPSEEERKLLRESLGIAQDEFAILTVADNQERKNLAMAMKIISGVKKESKQQIVYQLVTRMNNYAGYKIRDFASLIDIDINNELRTYERGMEFSKLWALYAAADLFFLPSKAEGLGMPILEAMATGLPVVATNCTGMAELLADGRGILVDPDYVFPDVFGNANRYLISEKKAISAIKKVMKGQGCDTEKARKFVEKRDWQKSIQLMDRIVREKVKK